MISRGAWVLTARGQRQMRTFISFPGAPLHKNSGRADRIGLQPGGQRPEASWITAR